MTVSVKQYFERTYVNALRTDEPCDAGYVWTLIDNIAHMVDESPKYRINFLNRAAEFNDSALIQLPARQPVFTFYFPTHLTNVNEYPCYDVRVAFSRFSQSGDPDVDAQRDVRASIVGLNVTQPISGVGPGVIGTLTGITPAPVVGALSTAWCIDGIITTGDVTLVPVVQQAAPAAAGVTSWPGEQMWLKLLVEIDEPEELWDYDDFANWGWLSGVQVREFPR